MAIPKSILEELLRTVDYDRLRLLAKNFPRMTGVNPPEFYVERMADVERVGFVMSDLTRDELLPMAQILGIDASNLCEYSLKKRCVSFLDLYSKIKSASKGLAPTSQHTFEMIKKNEGYDAIWTHLQIRRELLGNMIWSEGEKIARLTLATAFKAEGRMAVAMDVFLELVEDWPEPLLGKLRQIEAPKSAELLEKTYHLKFPSTGTIDERSTMLRNHVPDFPQEAKDWKRDWKATGENVDALARDYLLKKPDLF